MPPSFALQSLISKGQWYHSLSGVRHIDQETALMQAQRLHKGGHVEPNSALGTQKIPPAIVVPDVYSLIARIRLPV
jgi:hypothetical protein